MKKILLFSFILAFIPRVSYAEDCIVKYKDGTYILTMDNNYSKDDVEYIQKNFSYSIC